MIVRSVRRGRIPARVVLVVLGIAAAACGGANASSSTTRAPTTLTGSITVSAAASLTGTFDQLASEFEHAHPGTTITFNFGSSGTLVTQIQAGAPADVFASASTSDMDTLRTSGDVLGTPVVFARNTLELVVRPGNPFHIHSLADLARAPVVALCVITAPCGAAATEALRVSGVSIPTSRITLGTDVKATLEQVTAGDAAAAIVYVTDARTVGGAATAVPIPASHNVVTAYPIALVTGTANAPLGRAWISWVAGTQGQSVLHAAGFLPAS